MKDECNGVFSKVCFNAAGYMENGNEWVQCCSNFEGARSLYFINSYTLLDPYFHSRVIGTDEYDKNLLDSDVDALRTGLEGLDVRALSNGGKEWELIAAYVSGCQMVNDEAAKMKRGVERDLKMHFLSTVDGRPVGSANAVAQQDEEEEEGEEGEEGEDE